MLSKRIATVSSAVPVCSLFDGKIVPESDLGPAKCRGRKPPGVPVLALHKLQSKDYLRDNPSLVHKTDIGGVNKLVPGFRLQSTRPTVPLRYDGKAGWTTQRPNRSHHRDSAMQRHAMGLATARHACEEKKYHARHTSKARKVNGYSNISAPLIEHSLASPRASMAQASSRNLMQSTSTRRYHNNLASNYQEVRQRKPFIVLPPVGS